MAVRSVRIASLALNAALAACAGEDSFRADRRDGRGRVSRHGLHRHLRERNDELLAKGATVKIALAMDGSTTGRLFVPGAEGGGDLDADLSGSWTVVTFSRTADTFVRAAEFTAGLNGLEAETNFNGDVVRLALARTG